MKVKAKYKVFAYVNGQFYWNDQISPLDRLAIIMDRWWFSLTQAMRPLLAAWQEFGEAVMTAFLAGFRPHRIHKIKCKAFVNGSYIILSPHSYANYA